METCTHYMHTVLHKKWTPFSFFHSLLKWWSIYVKFSSAVAEEMLLVIQNISTKYGCWLINILCWPWRNADDIMCCEYMLACLNQCCQLLWWWTLSGSLMKKFWSFSTEQHRDMKSGVSRARYSLCVMVHCDAGKWKKTSYPTSAWKQLFWAIFVAAMVNQKISEPDKVHHRSRVATDSTGWANQACTHNTSLRHDYQRIFNYQPHVVEIFRISISSATTGKNFM